MSLGLARDSVHDLANLASHDSASTSTSTLGQKVPQEVGLSTVVALDLDELQKDDVSVASSKATEESTVAPVTTRSGSSRTPSLSSSSTYGQYAGFAADYADYEKYGGITYGDPYAHASVLLGEATKGGNWFCCMFPWMADSKKHIEGTQEDEDTESNGGNDLDMEESNKSDDEVSTGSESFGQKLTEKQRAAVIARLRLASPELVPEPPLASTPLEAEQVQPQSTGVPKELEYESGEEECKDDDGVNDCGIDSSATKPTRTIKPILRHSISKKPEAGMLKHELSTLSNAGSVASKRRSLFPQQYEQKPKNVNNVRFAPMARVVTVQSKNEMSDLEKSRIWFQKRDYDDFKKTGRMIAKAMCEGGSEIWLTTNDAWQSKISGGENGKTVRAIHSHDQKEIRDTQVSNGDKWWHKFGHSRRGLEHIASVEEGRQRQQNVRTAIRVVIDEQRRQKIYRKEDSEKLRMLSLQYTMWARDLALAAAASDAEAVEVDFDEKRKSREFYILKHARAQGGFSKQLPSFMMPVGRSPQVLDHNTSSQIRYRRKQARVAPTPTGKNDENSTSSSNASSEQPIHDGLVEAKANLAKKAAGFGTEDTDVSAILSGMGVVQKEPSMPPPPQAPTVGAH